ncbi:MAG TPA: 30S ribosome-binding factor RbfA [Planctomycetaceae bacterium]|nr:30S ribosome-binding factor RbfA [Planctomycetaceae bacterium]
MNSRRTLRVAEAIRETVSTLILFELRDPRVKNVTVLGAEVSGDLKHAKVYVSVMADEKHQQLALHGLNSARGFLQAKIADRLQLRYTPILSFVLDQGVKKSLEASRILREVLPESDSSAAEDDPADSVPDDESNSQLDIESS